MSEISLRAARATDLAPVLALLREAGLPTDGLDPTMSGFFVAETGARVVGAAGLEQYGRDGLLRSVVVAPSARGRALGARLTEAVIDEARRRGLGSVYALTTTAERYFPRLGFEAIERTSITGPVLESGEFRTICPSSAVALELRLEGPGS